MKFLQILTFYEKTLADFYARKPHLAKIGFDEQMAGLTNDAGGAHIIAPYMGKSGYDAQVVIANCEPAQKQWAREHDIGVEHAEKNWMPGIAQKQVEFFKPDILYLSDPLTFDSHFIRSLSWKPSLICGWRASSIPANTDWTTFDLILSNVRGCLSQALERGAKTSEYFHPGFPETMAEAVKDTPHTHDLVFAGGLQDWCHKGRRTCLLAAGKAPLGFGPNFSIAYYLNIVPQELETLPAGIAMYSHAPKFGLNMYKTLKSGRMVLNPVCDALGEDTDHVNMRHFETTGVGAFMLTNHHQHILEYFKQGVEIETFQDTKELVEKIHYYLEHSEERKAIARRGQERCLRDYSISQRAAEFHKIIQKKILKKKSPASHKPRSSIGTAYKSSEQSLSRQEPELKITETKDSDNFPAQKFPGVTFGRKAEELKILHLNTYDFGGAAKAAFRLFDGLRKSGHPSKMLVRKKQSSDPDVISLEDIRSMLPHKKTDSHLLPYQKQSDPDYYFFDRNISLDEDISSIPKLLHFQPDIIIVHWISSFVNTQDLFFLQKNTNAPIIYNLLDMGAMTGGCHYAWKCEGYLNQCGNCPALHSDSPDDFSHQNLALKKHFLQNMDISCVAATEWLFRQAKSSALFGNRTIKKILLGVDPQIFRPVSKEYARKKLNLPTEKKILFFGAESFEQRRKGMSFFLKSLEHLSKMQWISPRDTLLLSLGKKPPEQIVKSGLFPVAHADYISDRDDLLACFYQAADVFVCPSVEDSGPLMINEAVMCGTPVVSFEMGVALDLVHTGKTGYLAPSENSEELAKGISSVLNASSEMLQILQNNCHTLALRLFTSNIQVQNFEAFFKEITLNSPVGSEKEELKEDKETHITKSSQGFTKSSPKLLNLGCGTRIHPEWINVDFISRGSGVIEHDLRKGLPFESEEFDAAYHSHLLERLSKNEGKHLIQECYRVLKSGGVLRVAVPDLENIVREYLKWLDLAEKGVIGAEDNYDWILLELFDQIVRNVSGGEMGQFLSCPNIPNRDYVMERIGEEFLPAPESARSSISLETSSENRNLSFDEIGKFRMGGEVHQYMYDRFSLSRLLTAAGFHEIQVKSAEESNIPYFSKYGMDFFHGKPRGKSSLFMEGRK